MRPCKQTVAGVRTGRGRDDESAAGVFFGWISAAEKIPRWRKGGYTGRTAETANASGGLWTAPFHRVGTTVRELGGTRYRPQRRGADEVQPALERGVINAPDRSDRAGADRGQEQGEETEFEKHGCG